ncbi:hypothetical protein [Candidatus Lokiarchaeum ossiferum]|uniref:hypothetical protein n=1 Tax=Candidatus Lokiarchaeum ossiferum TaxID=2951803 RepID=UPI00352E99C8
MMFRNFIKAAPDYLSLKLSDFIGHFINLKTTDTFKNWIQYADYSKLMGYSCRSLFETCMRFLEKKDLVVATTPLHHTSFRNIIELHVQPENLHIIPFNDTYNGLGTLPKLDRCDIIVVTHLFGQDLNLTSLLEFKKKHNCIIIEDRVQGGTLDLKFSHDVVDIALYSMAMDKRPIALGGGIMHIRNNFRELIKYVRESVMDLPLEQVASRKKELLKKIPTYLLYNSRPFLYLFINIVNLLNRFNNDINLLNITQSYRKSNPGFSHNDFMLQPSNSLLKSMHENLGNYSFMEENYAKKSLYFMNCLPAEVRKFFFPWFKGNASLTPYNTIQVPESSIKHFLQYFNDHNMSVITNPTYKLFNFPNKFSQKDEQFNNGIIYLPSVANMKKFEIRYLASYIINFYMTYISAPSKSKTEKITPIQVIS